MDLPSVENLKLMDKMKRGFADSHQSNDSPKDANAKRKYHNLLEDYLELQKEYVSKKRKIQTAKQKREILLDEVGFLKQRYEYLINSQFSKAGPMLGLHQNADINVPVRKELNNTVNGVNENDIEQECDYAWKTTTIENKPKNVINENEVKRGK